MHTRGTQVICGGTASMRFYKGGHVFALSASPSLPPLSVSLSLLLSSPRYLTQSLPPPLSCCLSLLWITCIMSAPVEQPTWLETKSPTSSQVSKCGCRPSAPVSPGRTSCRALSPKCLLSHYCQFLTSETRGGHMNSAGLGHLLHSDR